MLYLKYLNLAGRNPINFGASKTSAFADLISLTELDNKQQEKFFMLKNKPNQ